MPIVANIELRVSTKDPREAIVECIALVRKNATSLESLQVDLSLICSANREVLLRLAERLPAKTLGFRSMGSDRAQTAEDFASGPANGFCTFNGNLTEHLLPADAFALIEELLKSPPSAIRSTAFTLDARNIQWKGSPQASSGSLYLSDLKAFNRVQRFSLSASLQLSSDDPKSKEVRAILSQVTQATGLGFEKARISRVLGEEGRSVAHANAILLGQICFDEALNGIAAQLRTGSVSEFAPDALAQGDAFKQRCQQWGGERAGKVNLLSVLKRAVKELLPELQFESGEADQVIFKKPLGPESEVIVLFMKALPRLGKAFTLSLGVRSVGKGIRFASDVFRLERTTEHRAWIYGDTLQADGAAQEAVNLAKGLLPRFESALRPHFESWPKELPADIEQHGKLSAREALSKAKPLARNLFPDAALIRVFNHPRSLRVRDIQGPELTIDGRLTLNALWWFHFYSAYRDVSFEVTVPSVGRIRVLDHGQQYDDAQYILNPVGEDWMDSDRAFALAEERGGRERRGSGETFGISTKLKMSNSQRPYWGIMYLVVDDRGRNDLIVNLDAITGEAITDIPGF